MAKYQRENLRTALLHSPNRSALLQSLATWSFSTFPGMSSPLFFLLLLVSLLLLTVHGAEQQGVPSNIVCVASTTGGGGLDSRARVSCHDLQSGVLFYDKAHSGYGVVAAIAKVPSTESAIVIAIVGERGRNSI